VAAFDSNMCNYARSCIPQAGTSRRLDAISDRLMYRLQYRNFGSYETFVTNHTVDVGGDRAGVRWYELRRSSGAFSVQQQGTWAPQDGAHRWMASAAMDKAGNLAVAYNTSSSTTYPAIYYAARLAGDPPNDLGQGEALILAGVGSQTHSASRWGDYSNLSVAPDGCTFWATLEYTNQGTALNTAPWRTRIASFTLPNCGGTGSAPSDPSPLTASATSTPSVILNWTNSSGETGYTLERCTGSACVPATTIANPTPDVTTYTDTLVASGTTYVYRVTARNDSGSTPSNTAEVTTPGGGGGTTLAAPTNLKATALRPSGVRLTWTDNATGETRFEILRSGGAGTVTIPVNQPDMTTYTDTSVASKTNYTYQVRACDATSCSAYSNTSQVRTR
jgi:hypothetical protein